VSWLSPEVVLDVGPELVTFRRGAREARFAPILWLAPEPPTRLLAVGASPHLTEAHMSVRPLDADHGAPPFLGRDEALTSLLWYGLVSVRPRVDLRRVTIVLCGLERFPEERRVGLAQTLGRLLWRFPMVRGARYQEPHLS